MKKFIQQHQDLIFIAVLLKTRGTHKNSLRLLGYNFLTNIQEN